MSLGTCGNNLESVFQVLLPNFILLAFFLSSMLQRQALEDFASGELCKVTFSYIVDKSSPC